MSVPNDLDPAAKRPEKEDKKLTRDMGSQEFASFLNLYDGPKVTVVVQTKKFSLPQRLLCHSSTYFDAVFNGKFKESLEEELDLTDSTTIEAFELVVKWMYTGVLVISADLRPEEKVTLFIDFFRLADYMDLLGPFTGSLEAVKVILIDSRDDGSSGEILTSQHIRNVVKLPAGHPLRDLIIGACLVPYINSLRAPKSKSSRATSTAPTGFKIFREMREVDAFAVDFLKVVDTALRARISYELRDPLTGRYFPGL